MRPRVAGEEFHALREALFDVDGQCVIPRVRVRKLRVHAVEGNGNTESNRIARCFCQGLLDLETASKSRACRARWRECGRAEREGWVRTGRAEEVEVRRC